MYACHDSPCLAKPSHACRDPTRLATPRLASPAVPDQTLPCRAPLPCLPYPAWPNRASSCLPCLAKPDLAMPRRACRAKARLGAPRLATPCRATPAACQTDGLVSGCAVSVGNSSKASSIAAHTSDSAIRSAYRLRYAASSRSTCPINSARLVGLAMMASTDS